MQLFINDLRQKLLLVSNQAAIRLFHTIIYCLYLSTIWHFYTSWAMRYIMHKGYHEIKYYDAIILNSV